ncbi:MAG TPA: alpha/beta hydrolase domain-containing protein, partial [Acidimicrobiales bacterium]|nr:alpha/beta hydrolase domain-containing protein [Acidimicrobiales bacterium]
EAVLAQGVPDLAAAGYVEEEFFVSGTASSYTSAEPLTSDGDWTVEPDEAADYTTRILVRRPADAARFDGTVFVEWLNVTGGLDAAAVFTQAQVEWLRSGAAWIGVSAQSAGISGEGGLGSALRLQNADPVRYAALSHPGDNFSYDLFSQVGGAVHTQADTVLGGLEPERVIATGESQSAFRLSTYVNAIAPRDHVYDGFLIVSRSADGAALSAPPQADVPAPSPTLVREDLDVPVLVFTSETDIAGGIGYAAARQPDTDRFRGWEVAGTAHYDAYGLTVGGSDDGSGATDVALFDAMSDPPSAIYGNIIACDRPFNAGPFTYVIRAASAALDQWARTGDAPPEMPRIELDDATDEVVTDGDGI